MKRKVDVLGEASTYPFFTRCQILPEFFEKKQKEWTQRISKETEEHCHYLTSVGLGDRASYFKVRPFVYQDIRIDRMDISRFETSMPVPQMVVEFNPKEKNTLFSAAESKEQDKQDELQRILDIRLYPTLIEEKDSLFFLGSKAELQAYTASFKEKILLELEVPSSVKYYITLTILGDIKVYISNLVSHENLLQQLITLKLANLDVQKIPILGDTQHYKTVCKTDLLNFEDQAATSLAKKNVLIIAGCSLEETICSTLEQICGGKIMKQKFSGALVSLNYVQSPHAPHLGFIILNLNYGEICEEQIAIILERFNCIGVFSGSAAGYIPSDLQEKMPAIGDRIAVHVARHHSGELVRLNEENHKLHLHVPTIYLETFKWLQEANALTSGAAQPDKTVDVETFYILRAIQKYQKANPKAKMLIDVGVFISDYVGKKPLRSYDKVFSQYPSVLRTFVDQVLVTNLTSAFNNNRTSTPTFANEYFELKPELITVPKIIRDEPVVNSIGTLWDKAEFSKRVHSPVTIAAVLNLTSQKIKSH